MKVRRPIPGTGKVFYSVDAKGGELVTFSECAHHRVGFSRMGEVLAAGGDVHSLTGAAMVGLGEEEFARRRKAGDRAAKNARQAAKPVNFGVPGSLGAVRLVHQQRASNDVDTPCARGPSEIWDLEREEFVAGYRGLRFCVLVADRPACGETKITTWGKDDWQRDIPPTCEVCVEVAAELIALVKKLYPEIPRYLKWHAENADHAGHTVHPLCGLKRGGIDYGSGANGDFQTGLAWLMGRAQVRVSYEQHADKDSPLYGSRSILFSHDELFGECDEKLGHEVATRVQEIIVEEFREACPIHAAACEAPPALMRRWYKSAEAVYRDGRLVPWEPK